MSVSVLGFVFDFQLPTYQLIQLPKAFPASFPAKIRLTHKTNSCCHPYLGKKGGQLEVYDVKRREAFAQFSQSSGRQGGISATRFQGRPAEARRSQSRTPRS
jgi:hypothetical protein